jgi:long-chain acyl-CoA synthetase
MMDRMSAPKAPETFPQFLLHNYSQFPNEIYMRHKKLGYWREYTWDYCYQIIKHFALGLASLGLQRGDKVIIIGDNEPEWVWAELAAQSLGAAVVGAWVDTVPSELEYITNHSESSFGIAKDQEQVDKFLELEGKIPLIKKVIYWDPKGMWAYKDNPFLISFEDVMEQGKQYETAHPGEFEDSIARGKAADLCVIGYTSGTTGLPKGVLQVYDYYMTQVMRWHRFLPWRAGDNHVSFGTMAWGGEQLAAVAAPLIFRSIPNFVEKPETVLQNIKEIGPDTLVLGPRQYEDWVSMVQSRIMDTGRIKQFVYESCMPVGYKMADFILAGRRPPLFLRALYSLAYAVCFWPIRDYLGVQNVRVAITGSAAMGPDVVRWFAAIGLYLKDAYGLTELPVATLQRDIATLGTSGPPTLGTEVRISIEGEIRLRSAGMFQGYYKQPDQTAKRLQNGWVVTGDAGFIDEVGNLIILDRLEFMLMLKSGDKYSPTYIENRLRFSPYIKDVMVIGGEDKDYILSTINIDYETVGKWAEKNRIPYTTYANLSQKEEVYDLIQRDIKTVNSRLPQSARVRKYVLLPKEFDADEGELTRTRKLKRTFLVERNQALIIAAFSNLNSVDIETEIKYRDGRKGKTVTKIAIRTLN